MDSNIFLLGPLLLAFLAGFAIQKWRRRRFKWKAVMDDRVREAHRNARPYVTIALVEDEIKKIPGVTDCQVMERAPGRIDILVEGGEDRVIAQWLHDHLPVGIYTCGNTPVEIDGRSIFLWRLGH